MWRRREHNRDGPRLEVTSHRATCTPPVRAMLFGGIAGPSAWQSRSIGGCWGWLRRVVGRAGRAWNVRGSFWAWIMGERWGHPVLAHLSIIRPHAPQVADFVDIDELWNLSFSQHAAGRRGQIIEAYHRYVHEPDHDQRAARAAVIRGARMAITAWGGSISRGRKSTRTRQVRSDAGHNCGLRGYRG